MQGNTRQCKALRKDGKSCTVKAVQANGYCVMHDPARATQLAGIRAAGGRAKSNTIRTVKALPANMQDVAALLLRSLSAVEADEMKPGQAQAIAALAGAYVRVVDAGELQAGIRDLQEQVAAVRRR